MAPVDDLSSAGLYTRDLPAFTDRVLEIVRLFHEQPVVRIRVVGIIAGGRPIDAVEEPQDEIVVQGPDIGARKHPAFHALRHYLCPSLMSVSSDAFELARIITPLLVGLKLSGKVDIELDPWLFAGLALVIERMGVAAFCAGYEKDEAPGAEPDHKTAPPDSQAAEQKLGRPRPRAKPDGRH